MSSLNPINCWNILIDQNATTKLETVIVNAIKNFDIGQSAAKLLKHNCYGEGSTTIENTKNILEVSRVDSFESKSRATLS